MSFAVLMVDVWLTRIAGGHKTPRSQRRTDTGLTSLTGGLPEVHTVDSEELLRHFEMQCDGERSPVNLHPIKGIARVRHLRFLGCSC